jgi:hypothetical protein
MADIDTLIANAQKRANELTSAAIAAAGSYPREPFIDANADKFVAAPYGSNKYLERQYKGRWLREQPPPYTGNVDITTDIYRVFQDGFSQFKPEMKEALAEYIAQFFPDCVYATTNDWICNTVLYGGTGIPADIEAQIWQRARARDTIEAAKLRDTAVLQFASRGFSLPSGALSARLLEIEQDASNKSSTISRDVAIKQAELEIENIKFAVSEGVKVRTSVLAAIADYVKAYLTPIDQANTRADIMARSKGVLMNSAADYYRAMIAEAELVFKEQNANLDADVALSTSYNSASQQFASTVAQISSASVSALSSAAGQAAGSAMSLASSTVQEIASAS